MRLHKLKKWIIPISCGLFIILLFQLVLIIGYVPTRSMEPAISKGSCIIGTRIYGELQRGDVVIFNKNGAMVVKRVAGIPGDEVYIVDNKKAVSINQSLDNATRMLTVPEGHYFMLGDYLEDSFDSRYWEDPFISAESIKARLF